MPRANRTTPAAPPEGAVRYSLLNWILLGAGLASIVAGYLALGAASTVAAPLLLVLGYVVLIPLGIIL
jgi:hypothetical protein